MPQLQINQGPQDALLYDNTRSYFTNVGYVRTSNFQVEYRHVDPQNTPQFGSTVQYVIPKAADLLGPVDLRITIPKPESATKAGLPGTLVGTAGSRAFTQWVEELGFAMIDKITFSVGSNDIETITGEELQIKNELMTSDEQRLGFDHVMKSGKPAFSGAVATTAADEYPGDGLGNGTAVPLTKTFNKDFTRLIGMEDSTAQYTSGERELIIPLGLFFTKHVSQYFPLAAVAGCNDVRIAIKFRALKELIQLGGETAAAKNGAADIVKMPTFGNITAKLMCHYVHVTGPEATTLMNKEHVRLLKLWQGQHKVFDTVTGNKLELDLSFLHPVTTLVVTIRRADDMTTDDGFTQGNGASTKGGPSINARQKNFFAYHGDGTQPNIDAHSDIKGTIKVKSMQLTLNGQERHPGLSEGIDVDYLQHRLLPMLHSNSNQVQKQVGGGTKMGKQLYQMQGSKNIFVYPFSLNPEGSNPSGAVNFSKVSHAKLNINLEAPVASSPIASDAKGMPGASASDGKSALRVDVYGLYYNWLQIKDGRALLSFA